MKDSGHAAKLQNALTEGDNLYFDILMAFSTDAEGNKVLIGLSCDETIECIKLSKIALSGAYDGGNPDHRLAAERFLVLDEKHRQAMMLDAAEKLSTKGLL